MDKNKIDQKIEAALGSFDGMERATASPYLLTKINARLQQDLPLGFWSKAFAFFSRPLVAVAVMALLVLNIIFISQKENISGNNNTAIQNTATTKYDFAINVSSMYDVENQ